MVKVRHNLKGERFGRLVVLEQCEDWVSPTNGLHKAQWLCQCDCGNQCKVVGSDLISKNKQSCNCLHFETIADRHKYNKYNLDGEYGIGYTEDGTEFYFDLEDYDLIKKYRWTEENGYIICYKVQNGKKYRIQMHRLLMKLPMKDKIQQVVDHKNLQRNDNRKENLRICTYSQNQCNRDRQREARRNSSGYTGIEVIHTKTKGDKYRVKITVNKKGYYLGYFTNLQDAIKARQKGEEKYHGEFAYKRN
jgi:hypothetical protein